MIIKMQREKDGGVSPAFLVDALLFCGHRVWFDRYFWFVEVPDLPAYLTAAWRYLSVVSTGTAVRAVRLYLFHRWYFRVEGNPRIFWWQYEEKPTQCIRYGVAREIE